MFLFKLVAARHFGTEQFGLYSLIETILGLTLIVSSLGLFQGIARYVPIYKEKKKFKVLSGYLSFIFLVSISFSILLSLLIGLFSKNITLFLGYPDVFSQYLKIVIFLIPLQILSRIYRKILLAQKKVLLNQLSAQYIEPFILFSCSLIILYFNMSLIFLIYSLIFAYVVAFVFDFIAYQKNKIKYYTKKVFLHKEWLIFSLPLMMTGVMAYIIRWSDNLIIAAILPPSSLGVYSVAYSLGALLIFVYQAFSAFFLPIISESLAKKRTHEISLFMKKTASWITIFTVPTFFVIIFFPKSILSLLYGNAYAAGSLSLIIIAIGVFLNISVGLVDQILILYKRTQVILYSNIIIAILNLILNYILILQYNIVGAAIASAISLVLQKLIFLYFSRKHVSFSYQYSSLVKSFIAAGISLSLCIFIYRLIPNIPGALLSLFIYGGLYLILIFMFKVFDKKDKVLLITLWKKS